MALEFRPLHPLFAAEASGADLRRPLAAEAVRYPLNYGSAEELRTAGVHALCASPAEIPAVLAKANQANLKANIERHFYFIDRAAAQGAEFIGFPELSLNGYNFSTTTTWTPPSGPSGARSVNAGPGQPSGPSDIVDDAMRLLKAEPALPVDAEKIDWMRMDYAPRAAIGADRVIAAVDSRGGRVAIAVGEATSNFTSRPERKPRSCSAEKSRGSAVAMRMLLSSTAIGTTW